MRRERDLRRYHCFYYEPIGMDHKHVVFDTEEEMLELVHKANEPNNYAVAGLSVVLGFELRFEPYEKVKSWRIKEEL